MNKSELISIRNYVQDDRNFILATFLRGLYYGDSWFSQMEKKAFMEHYNKVVNFILDSPKTTIKIACLKEDPNVVLGYALLAEPNGVHWIHVKREWRKIGLARDLVPNTVNTVTHLSKVGLSIVKNHNLKFNPFLGLS